MLNRFVMLAVLLVGIALIAPSPAQVPPPGKPPLPGKLPDPLTALQKLLGAKAADLDQAIRGVSAYPKRTRNAILDIAKYSEKHTTLVADLARLRTGPAADIDKYLTANKLEPDLQQAAALVLVEAPETFDRMKERPDLVRLVGVAWSTPPGREPITAVLDAAGAAQEKSRSASADRWATRLKADPKLMQQFTQLLEDYTARTADANTPLDDSWQSHGYGTYKTKDGYAVTDVPSSEVINYSLAVGPQYPLVANALIQQYFSGTNSDDYNSAVGGWYSANGSSIPDSSRQNNADYYALLQELSQLADALASSYSGSGASNTGTGSGDGSYGNGYGDSYGNSGDGNRAGAVVAGNGNQYPKLTNWRGANPAPNLGSVANIPRLPANPTNKPFESGKAPSASPFSDHMKGTPAADRARPTPQASQNPFSVAAKKPAPSTGPKPAGQQLARATPPMGQQLTRAQGQMHSAWKPPAGGGPRPKR
jgi:hypothetical protein